MNLFHYIFQQVSGANLGLGRDMLLRGWDDIIKAYHTYMVNVSMFLGANKTQAENDFANVLMFEMMLANVSLILKLKWQVHWLNLFLIQFKL